MDQKTKVQKLNNLFKITPEVSRIPGIQKYAARPGVSTLNHYTYITYNPSSFYS